MELGRITAEGGSFLIADTSAHTGKGAYGFYVVEDTVVALMKGGTTSSLININFLTSFGISGETLKAGSLFLSPKPYVINSITLTSGSIIVYYTSEYTMSLNASV